MHTPTSICLLRTSAIGDVTHVVPLVRTLQKAWPQTRLTWIVGKLEHTLVGDLPDVNFICFDKRATCHSTHAVWQNLHNQRFDALLQMQVAMRSNLLSLGIKANRRIGYDRARSRDLHGYFINERIEARSGEHVLDAIGSFVEPLGLKQTQVHWDIPLPDEAQDWAAAQWPERTPTLLVSPCSRHSLRNWRAERYAAVMDHATKRGWLTVLIGGPSPNDHATAGAIAAQCRNTPLNLTGKDTLKKLLALLARATLLLTPDSGPMHIANTVGTKVLGLHAATNPKRSGPYCDLRWCVNKYDQAARTYLGRSSQSIPWGRKIEFPGVMDLISVDHVIERFDAFADHVHLA